MVGIPNASPEQIDLAARGAAWGDAVGIALANNLGDLYDQTTNFIEAAAQGLAVYGTSLEGQADAAAFQGDLLSFSSIADQMLSHSFEDPLVMA